MRRAARAVAALVCGAAVAAACTAPAGGTGPGPTTTTTTAPGEAGPPVVTAFEVLGSGRPAPATVALRWSATDPAGAGLVCQVDLTDDGTYDLTVVGCAGETVRTVTFPTAGTSTVRLLVADGVSADVTVTRQVVVAPPTAEPFDIDLELVGDFTPARTAAFTAAAERWSSVVRSGLPDLPLTYDAGGCGSDAPAFSGTVDDVRIVASVVPVDGPGNVLASAGPCYFRTASGLSLAGLMRFDVADLAALEASGDLTDVVLHEMGHVLGIGTLGVWSSQQTGAGTADSAFVGVRAVGAWQELGGSGAVPVESDGGAGTADAHWRESVFRTELMTGFEDRGPDPLSRLTVAMLGDLGYSVDLSAADAFLLPLPRAVLPGLRAARTPTEVLVRPVAGVPGG